MNSGPAMPKSTIVKNIARLTTPQRVQLERIFSLMPPQRCSSWMKKTTRVQAIPYCSFSGVTFQVVAHSIHWPPEV